MFIASGDSVFVKNSELLTHDVQPQILHASGANAVRIVIGSPYAHLVTTGEYAVQWEHKLITETMNADQLNELGADGWELVMVATPAHFVFHYFFKRELRG